MHSQRKNNAIFSPKRLVIVETSVVSTGKGHYVLVAYLNVIVWVLGACIGC